MEHIHFVRETWNKNKQANKQTTTTKTKTIQKKANTFDEYRCKTQQNSNKSNLKIYKKYYIP